MSTTKSLLLATLSAIALINSASATDIQFSYECQSIGTRITGEKNSKIKETFSYEEKSLKSTNKDKDWGDAKMMDTNFYSDGNKVEATLTSYSDKYAFYTYATQSGKGFGAKVYSFAFFIDFDALTLERVVTTFPQGSEERTIGTCQKAPYKKH